jgi:SAM-dependent methyltransferase
MGLADWDQRHLAADLERRSRERAPTFPEPSPLVERIAKRLPPGRALDLACGRGRDSLWLARRGWSVTAVDGSPAAIEIVRRDAAAFGLAAQGAVLDARAADLEKHEFTIAPSAWDLILICGYFQPDLYAPAIKGLVPGGVIVATALLAEAGEHRYRVAPGAFERYFAGLEILHSRERHSRNPHSQGIRGAHAVAEIAAVLRAEGGRESARYV